MCAVSESVELAAALRENDVGDVCSCVRVRQCCPQA